MNTSPANEASDRELESRARGIFDAACNHVDARTRIRLAAARASALDAQGKSSSHRLWMPAAGAVAACVLALGIVWFHPRSAPTQPMQAQAQASSAEAELPLDADNEQLELYQNLDFYQWLAERQTPRAPAGAAQ